MENYCFQGSYQHFEVTNKYYKAYYSSKRLKIMKSKSKQIRSVLVVFRNK